MRHVVVWQTLIGGAAEGSELPSPTREPLLVAPGVGTAGVSYYRTRVHATGFTVEAYVCGESELERAGRLKDWVARLSATEQPMVETALRDLVQLKDEKDRGVVRERQAEDKALAWHFARTALDWVDGARARRRQRQEL